jgi:uroporphyrin-III C-methyltransferase / precorrin-2 dehydrogenase / sirohydrochlorin ferrochelatase
VESLPLFHRLAGQPVLVLGDGEAAAAKARLVEEAGGTVVTEAMPGVRLAFVAMDDGAEGAAAGLRAAGCLVNVVDRPELCDFTVPALVDRSPVVVAVGTGGASASLSKALKERLEVLLPASLGNLAAAIAQSRAAVGAVHGDVPARRDFWARVLAPGGALDPLVAQADPQAAISEALAGGGGAEDRLDEIVVPADGADGLTLRQLRLMAQADLVVHEAGMGADVLALIRRDAARQVGTGAPEGAGGRVLLIRAGPAA